MIQQKTPKKIKGERKKRAAERKALQSKIAEIQRTESEIENAEVLKIGGKYFVRKSALYTKRADDLEGGKKACELLAELESHGIKEIEVLSDAQWDILAHGEKSPYYKKEGDD